MILPIVLYGNPVLRQKGRDLAPNEAGTAELIANMYETMYNATGVGLAAPQIGQPLRLFLIDAKPMADLVESEEEQAYLTSFKRTIINPTIIAEQGTKWPFEEGCLSIPGIRENVNRKPIIHVRYLDEHFQPREETLGGIAARIFQHEYDHVEGVLFTDHLPAFKKQLLRAKLTRMAKRGAEAEYPVVPPAR